MELTTKEQILYRRYRNIPEVKIPSKELIAIASLIDQMKEDNINLEQIKLREVTKKSREFLSKYFTLNLVPFEQRITIPFVGELQIYKQVHPFQVPIKKIKNTDIFYGCSREVIYPDSDEFLKYRWIELSEKLTELASLAYTHEIVHMQLNHCTDVIEDYNNIEFLSIFLELVEALELSENESLLQIHDTIRLRELQDIILDLDKYATTKDETIKDILVEGTSYLHSTLKAYHLFLIYYTNIKMRKKIMERIQKVFHHQMTVEQFQNEFGITYENSEDKEKFKKYFKRRL